MRRRSRRCSCGLLWGRCPLVHDQRNVSEIGVGHVSPGNSDGGHGEAAQPKVAPQFLLRQIMQGNQVLGSSTGALRENLVLTSVPFWVTLSPIERMPSPTEAEYAP